MGRFLRTFFLFLSPVIVVSALMEGLLEHIPNDYMYKRKYLDAHSNEIEVLVLGSSHSYKGIDPEFISCKCFNAAYVSQSFDYDYAILRKYEDNWKNLKCIVVPVSYFSFNRTLHYSVEKWREKDYTLYYGIRQSYNPVNYCEVLSNNLNTNIKRITSYYFDKKDQLTCDSLGWGQVSFPEKISIDSLGKVRAAGATAKNSDHFAENVRSLTEILDFANQRKIKVLMVTIPVYKSYLDNIRKSQMDTTVNTTYHLTSVYKNAAYYNFLSDSSYSLNDFADCDHLNHSGARKFSHTVDSLITFLMDRH